MNRALTLHSVHDLRLDELPEAPLHPGEVRLRLGAGGICGSDLHYWAHGGVGDFKLRQPMVLGHEVAGTVSDIGEGVDTLRPGQRVTINPARPCRNCDQCLSGHANRCRNVRFYGSAARFPHVQGAFAESFVADQAQCFPIPDELPFAVAAMAEPLAVTLHAVGQAGPLLGRDVLIVGAGPIGALCVLSVRLAGARRITICDVQDAPLMVAAKLGADRVVNVSRETLDDLEVDAALEASGSAAGLASALSALMPGGTLVQLGMFPPGPISVPLGLAISRELRVIGSFRFAAEFGLAAELLSLGRLDVTPLLSAQFELSHAADAFALAADRSRAMKVSLVPDVH
ncbi:L-idonate 5-dehydrogenase [Deinococcus sp.]|uniref:L-idonate 5-dehydrogenase n=1 Tax=Deinococcus sp. TaxID=47478 RepID=UPI003B5ACA12